MQTALLLHCADLHSPIMEPAADRRLADMICAEFEAQVAALPCPQLCLCSFRRKKRGLSWPLRWLHAVQQRSRLGKRLLRVVVQLTSDVALRVGMNGCPTDDQAEKERSLKLPVTTMNASTLLAKASMARPF